MFARGIVNITTTLILPFCCALAFFRYTAHAKNRFDGAWYSLNDAHCDRVDPAQERLGSGPSAYCLFYNRTERMRSEHGAPEKRTVIRRQSLARPELWPHLQRAKAAEWKSVRDEG